MTNAACPVCHRRQDDGITCHACICIFEYELADHEQGVTAITTELETTLARQGRGELNGKGGLARERNGYHAGASQAMDDLTNALTYWASAITGIPGSAWATVPRPAERAAQTLLDNIPGVRSHIDAAELHNGIVDAMREARRVIDRAANRTIIEVGPCPEDDENDVPCPGRVFAFIPTEDDRPSRMECRTNPVHRWTTIQWLRAGKRMLDRIEQMRQQREAA